MRLDVSSYNNGGATWNAAAQETGIINFRLQHGFGYPAMCEIVLSDPDGSKAQKYNVDANDVYLGVGKVELEHPTGTDRFKGRIMRARHNSFNGRTTLLCMDWLSQLDERIEDYDMREDLDGSGTYFSRLASDPNNATTKRVAHTEGEPEERDCYVVDRTMNCAPNEWNGKKLVLIHEPCIVEQPLYLYVGVDEDSGGLDTQTGDYNSMRWVDNDFYLQQDATKAHWFTMYFHLESYAGSLYVSGPVPESMSLYMKGSSKASISTVYIYNYDDAAYEELTETFSYTGGGFHDYTWRLPMDENGTYDPYLSSGGIVRLRVVVLPTVHLAIDQLLLRAEFVLNGYSTPLTILDTLKSSYGNYLYAAKYDHSATSYTDYTTEINEDTADDVLLLPDPLGQYDAFYFGAEYQYEELTFVLSTQGDYDGSASWQYWDGSAWTNLGDVTDGTNKFEAVAGTYTVSFTCPTDWATTTINGEGPYYYIRLWVWSAVCNMRTVPKATEVYPLNVGAMIKVNIDCSSTGLGLWEGYPYSIVKPIYKHIDTVEGGTLVTDSDPVQTITAAATIEHTTGACAHQFKNLTRLEKLRSLADLDGAVLWMALGGTTLTYKSTFNSGAPTALTDATVLKWIDSEYDYEAMRNEARVWGVKVGDEEVYQTSSDATSIAKYLATRTQLYRGSGVLSMMEAKDMADALVARDKTVQYFLQAELAGFASSYLLGTEVAVTSSHLDLTAANYVVTHFTYNSIHNKTVIRLAPRSTVGYSIHYLHPEEYISEHLADADMTRRVSTYMSRNE